MFPPTNTFFSPDRPHFLAEDWPLVPRLGAPREATPGGRASGAEFVAALLRAMERGGHSDAEEPGGEVA